MKLPAWVDRILGGSTEEFPTPRGVNMTPGELCAFWESLSWEHKKECRVIVYRLDPARAPFPSMAKSDYRFDPDMSALVPWLRELELIPPGAWRVEHPEVQAVTLCVRIKRIYQTEYGRREQEVCVCSFEVDRVTR
jgi:hypothetical protein